MGMFDIFKKKAKVPRAEGKKSDSNVFENPAVEQHQAARPWVDRHYMSGYDVGGIKGYTDLMEKPRCDEVGKDALFKWVRYGQIVIIAGFYLLLAQNTQNDDCWRKKYSGRKICTLASVAIFGEIALEQNERKHERFVLPFSVFLCLFMA